MHNGGKAPARTARGAQCMRHRCAQSGRRARAIAEHSGRQLCVREAKLTEREAEVMMWIVHGKTNKEIALILDISPRTVNKYLEQIFRKLSVDNRTSAAFAALECIRQRWA
jgi:DNA-binding CsgD family transcriptional regulator